MDLDFLTKILAAGAMGVSIFCIFKVYNLLSIEQEKDEPRPIIITSIHRFMTFGVVMTVLSLGIEYARHLMNNSQGNEATNNANLILQLKNLKEKDLYTIDKSYNSTITKITYGGEEYQLNKNLSTNTLEKSDLFIKKEQDNYSVIKKNNGKEFKLGVIQNFNEFLPSTKKTVETQFASGIYYTKKELLQIVQKELDNKKDKSLAIANLSQVIDPKYKTDAIKNLKKIATKLLIQPELLEEGLDATQYENLLRAIKDFRPTLYGHYELAQVYYHRWDKFKEKTDFNNYQNALKAYISSYESNKRSRDTLTYSLEYDWYKDARENLK